MGKVAPDLMIDSAFDYISGSAQYETVCSGSPATFADAWTNNILAKIVITGSGMAKADDTSGRKITMPALTSASITASGSALAVCLVNTTNSGLLYVTTCTQQYLVSGGTVDIPAWKMEKSSLDNYIG